MKLETLSNEDPTKSTRIQPPDDSGEPVRIIDNGPGRLVKVYASEEGNFYSLTQHPATQELMSRMLKLFFPVADVVRTEKDRYSFEPITGKINNESSPEEMDEKIEADQRLIGWLIGDTDRRTNQTNHLGGYLFYDFEYGYNFWSPPSLRYFASWFEGLPSAVQTYVSDKLTRMLAYHEDPAGREQTEAAFEATGEQISELFADRPQATFENFYEEFVRRIRKMHETASRIANTNAT